MVCAGPCTSRCNARASMRSSSRTWSRNVPRTGRYGAAGAFLTRMKKEKVLEYSSLTVFPPIVSSHRWLESDPHGLNSGAFSMYFFFYASQNPFQEQTSFPAGVAGWWGTGLQAAHVLWHGAGAGRGSARRDEPHGEPWAVARHALYLHYRQRHARAFTPVLAKAHEHEA